MTATKKRKSSNSEVVVENGRKSTDGETKKKKKKHGKVDSRGRLVSKTKPAVSKKKEKYLKKVLERKQKNADRASLLSNLAEHAASISELGQLQSITQIHRKRRKSKDAAPRELETEEDSGPEPDDDAMDESAAGTDPPEDGEDEEVEVTDTMAPKDVEMDTAPCEVVIDEATTSADVEIVDEPKPSTSKVKRQPPNTIPKPSVFVAVNRTAEVQKQREQLPIIGEEHTIIGAIRDNDVVILTGETGSGKTTQVPQFLYEAGYATGRMIAVTEPRRVAAISMSKRVAHELNLSTDVVSYQIRFEGNVTDRTQIKFLTDGVLLKEIQRDFLLRRYSVVIIDEAHDRSMYSDILLGLLSRIVPLRAKRKDPLKLIVMSATLRVNDFVHLFKQEPTVISVESRQFPVTVYFNRMTDENFLLEAYKKVCKLHRLLPDGGILVFLSGQAEVHTLIRWLQETQHKRTHKKRVKQKKIAPPLPTSLDAYDVADLLKAPEPESVNDVDTYETDALLDDDDITNTSLSLEETEMASPLYLLPMYSMLPAHEQRKVFEPPPEGHRLCVVATNVAETSITIPGVRYVVDSGKVKQRVYDAMTGVAQFRVTWISQAAANQRAGRAGRVSAGHCYRLYSSAVFSEFEQFPAPEIMEKPVDDLVLQMKSMRILNVANFPFPTPPDRDALQAAEDRLVAIEALERPPLGTKKSQDDINKSAAKVTELGQTISVFPVSPFYGKIIALSNQHELLPYALALVAALSVRELLCDFSALKNTSQSSQTKERAQRWLSARHTWASAGQAQLLGDFAVLLKGLCAAEYAVQERAKPLQVFCEAVGLRSKAVLEARAMRRQLARIVNACMECDVPDGPPVEPPSETQLKYLRQIVLMGLVDNVAKLHEVDAEGNYVKGGYQCCFGMKELIFIHPTSVLARSRPEYIVYQHLIEANTGKMYAQVCMALEGAWLPRFAKARCTFGEIVPDPPPTYNGERDRVMASAAATYGAFAWELPGLAVLDHPITLEYYRHIAVALLDGRLCPPLEKHRAHLLVAPDALLRSWALQHGRTKRLLAALAQKEVVSRTKLEEIWKTNEQFLCAEYCAFLPDETYKKVENMVEAKQDPFSVVHSRLRQLSPTCSHSLAELTVKAALKAIATSTWSNVSELIVLLQNELRRSERLCPHQFVVRNVLLRILKLVRDESERGSVETADMAALQKSLMSLSLTERSDATRKELRAALVEVVREWQTEQQGTLDELVSLHAADHFNSGDVVMTTGYSRSCFALLQEACTTHGKRVKLIVVGEEAGRLWKAGAAKNGLKLGIDVVDHAHVFGRMASVNKVLLSARYVMADGSLVSVCGATCIALAARHYSTPVLVATPTHKLTPVFAEAHFKGSSDKLLQRSPLDLVDFFNSHDFEDVDFVNEAFDFVSCDLISLYLTNMSACSPDFIYKAIQELYHPDDACLLQK